MSCGDGWRWLSERKCSPANKMLKPDKWNSGFTADGKILSFHNTLKRIILGGVDPSIRPHVWEFLLGSYAVATSSEYRTRLRTARRERYEELIKQCQLMHSSIGTGSLAYVVGAKLMDMRAPEPNVTGKAEEDERESDTHKRLKLRFKDEQMHNFQISNNDELIIESNLSRFSASNNSDGNNIEKKKEIVNRMRISDTEFLDGMLPQPEADKVSEWLWTLHRIVVDVVRTDSHLEFYQDTRNLARMSDILAVYAWVDPATGYCQGMSDLLSPFIVLFEDDADAFWCFEMLLRRTRENFQMEGPTGVMKQLQQLSSILELTDREMFAHLSNIGAESLHFAFRMLLVLFRRELPFHEALSMWEMMWAADFNESMINYLEKNCLETLNVRIKRDEETETRDASVENGKDGDYSISNNETGTKSTTTQFCGWTTNFWSREDLTGICSSGSSSNKVDDELPVFCVAAILIINRQKIIRETRSIDDMIKIFNDKILRINAKRCVRIAIKIRKKYFYKVIKRKDSMAGNGE